MDQIRIATPLFFKDDDGELPVSAKQLEIVEINRYLARDLNALWHSRLPIYDTGFCLNSIVSFGALYKNVYYAIAIWTNPVAANLPQHEWLELRRMAIAPDAPKYTATRMLSKMAKHIMVNLKQVSTLVSYQDMEVHQGTIYKAANWTASGIHKGGSWDRPNAKNLNGKPRTRPDKNNATGPKQRWTYELRRPMTKPNTRLHPTAGGLRQNDMFSPESDPALEGFTPSSG